MAHRVLVLFAETPVHAGAGEALGVVALPIQREAVTRLPVIWGQSLKGALRDHLRHLLDADELTRIFGARLAPPDPTRSTTDGAPSPGASGDGAVSQAVASLSKGAVAVGDAQLLLFPASTLVHTFAWVLSPMLLGRLRRKLAICGITDTAGLALTRPPDRMIVAGRSWSGQQVLGPFVQPIRNDDPALSTVAATLSRLVFPDNDVFDESRRKLGTDLLAVDDGVLGELTETGTEITARVQLTDQKTVGNGPFHTEYLPAESVLTAVLTGPDTDLDALTEHLDGAAVQIGGDETIGKGLMWCRVHDTTSLSTATPSTATPPATPSPAGSAASASVGTGPGTGSATTTAPTTTAPTARDTGGAGRGTRPTPMSMTPTRRPR